MKTVLTSSFAISSLAVALASAQGANLIEDFVAGVIVGSPGVNARPSYVAVADPGYIVYSDYAAALPGPNCFWTRMPIYDTDRTVIGWRGRPVAVCPQPKVSADLATGH
jgi:hypothetical protein